jgi:MFS family permease
MASSRPASAIGGFSSLGQREWIVLAITFTFWLFDGYETYALLLTLGPSLHELLPAAALRALPRFAGYLIATTLFGWAVGGVIGGVFGDRIGRRKTMIGAVVVYSIFTATSALSHNWETLAVTRFLTGLGIGAEWGVGASLLQEIWPNDLRTKGAGVLQAGFSLGFFVASGIWLLLGGVLGTSWRWMYLLGVVPAIIVALCGRAIPESSRWVSAAQRSGAQFWSILRTYRRMFLWTVLTSIAITVPFWAISSWVPTYAASLGATPRAGVYLASMAGIWYAVGEIVGCVGFGFLADSWGRRPTTIVFFIGSLVITPVVFVLVHDANVVVGLQFVNGALTGGIYSWYTIHPPELFPTSIRATAVSFIFNVSRFLAMVGPLVSSLLIGFFGGYGIAATAFALIYLLGIVGVLLLPETKGRLLPE